jgi:hypothetical protein
MGIASTKKFIKQLLGTLTEEAALTTTAGAADADRIPALNASGVLDSSLLNGTVTSTGAPSAGKTPILDPTGRLDASTMPVGIAPETGSITASEALADGDFVNIWNNGGTPNVRKADASTTGKEAHGYVLAAVASSGTALVYFEGANTHLTGMTAGPRFLSSTTPGGTQGTAPTGSGQIVQNLGIAYSATVLTFEPQQPIALA